MLRTAIAAIAVALVGGAGLWEGTVGFRAFTTEGARRISVLERPRDMPDVRLIDMDGRELTLAGESDRTAVIEFIYTTCPTLCVSSGESFAKLQAAIRSAGFSDRVQLISISFDLARDGSEALKDYAEAHGADGRVWITARPENEQALHSLLGAFGVTVVPDGLGGFVHNAAMHLVDRHRRLKGIFDINEATQVLAALRGEW